MGPRFPVAPPCRGSGGRLAAAERRSGRYGHGRGGCAQAGAAHRCRAGRPAAGASAGSGSAGRWCGTRCTAPSSEPGTARSAPTRSTSEAVSGLPPLARASRPYSTLRACCCTQTSAGRRCLVPRAMRLAAAAGCTDLEFDLASGSARQTRRGDARRAGAGGARRGGRARGEQQRRRAGAGRDGAGRRPRDRREQGRADRDRRRLPAARTAGQHRRDDPRGRQHESDVGGRLRGRARAADRLRAQGAPVELPDRWIYGRARGSPNWPGSASRWSATSDPGCSRRTPRCPTSRTPRPGCGPARRW